MFSTFKQRLLLGLFILFILSIPVGAYLISQTQTYKSSASEQKQKLPVTSAKPTTSPAKKLLSVSETNLHENTPSEQTTPESSTTIATQVGPTLSLKAKLEGRPEGNQLTRLFIGIMEGSLTANPKFLLNFTVDLPATGIFSNLSLAGLNPGTKYTALLKGSAQIATSSAFIMSPTVTNLNDGQALPLASGDLNDDNVINTADYSIAQRAFGAIPTSSNWNDNIDLNKDGVVNVIDLSIIRKNLGSVGASGTWTSPLPNIVTKSVEINTPIGSPNQSQGYWIWVPNL